MASASDVPMNVGEPPLVGLRVVRLLGALAFGHSLVHFLTHGFVVLAAHVVSVLGLPPSALGIILASRSLGGAVSQFPFGMLADRFAHRRTALMTMGLLWFGFFYFLMGFTSEVVGITVLAFFVGFGGAFWHPAAVGLVSTRMPGRRAFGMAIHGIGAGAGDSLGPLVIGGLLAFFAWQTVFRIALIPAVIWAVVFLILMQGFATGHSRGHTSMRDYFRALGDAARHRPLLMSVIAGSSRTGGQVILIGFVTLYAKETLDLGDGAVGAIASLLLGLSIVSQPVMAYISDRIGRKWTVVPSAAALTGLSLLLLLATNAALLFLVVTLIGLIMFSTALVLNAYGLDIAPTELHSSITAAQFLSGLAIGAISPSIAGFVADGFGIQASFIVAAVFFGITTVMVLLLPDVRGSKPTARFGFA